MYIYVNLYKYIYIMYFTSLFGCFIFMVATIVISLRRFYQNIDY